MMRSLRRVREREKEREREKKKKKKKKKKKGISYLAAAPDDVRIRLELVGTFFPIVVVRFG
jgi:hypothetical protein